MRCPFCWYEFDEKAAGKSCAGCSLFGGCEMIKCPRCGYESPREPGWIKRLSRLFQRRKQG